ncbi:MAG: hypothetical protein K9H64_06485 [Bacteroidales bacterium]|nr:hypothetical protein [Bacteroidales bacterium]MCF8455344.1 hypothetical protein [Bacteroidales bacterium]
MEFSIDEINRLLPPELAPQKKNRLREGLKQFIHQNTENDKFYTEFYLSNSNSYFLQGDLIKELRFPVFNSETKMYNKEYFDALLLSNTCDVFETHKRNIPKKVIVAKVITLNAFIESMNELEVENAAEILTKIKNQQYSNVFYLPPTKTSVEYVAYLDDISIIENSELILLKEDIHDNRIESMDLFGYYLFIFKLSFHLCRLPEDANR